MMGLYLKNQFQYVFSPGRIDALDLLIRENFFLFLGQGPGDGDTLLLTAAQGFRSLVFLLLQSDFANGLPALSFFLSVLNLS